MGNEDKYSNKEIAELLRNIAAAYKLRPSNESGLRFKIIAYEKAADAVEYLSREIKDIWAEGKLQKVPGIGPGIGSSLSEYFEKGESTNFNEILKGIPKSVFLLMKVPGLGPKKAFRLVAQFGITDPETAVGDLRNLARADKISGLEGFGKKSQEDILEGLAVFEKKDRREERMPLPYAFDIAGEVIEYIQKLGPIIKRVDALGSLRRRVATIGDIDIAVGLDSQILGSDPKRVRPLQDFQKVVDHFLKYPGKRSVEAAGDRKASILAAGNIRIDLRVQEAESYGSMLQYFTGSKAHNIKLRELALKKGYSLNEYGLKQIRNPKFEIRNKSKTINSKLKKENTQDDMRIFKNEEELYSFLGLQTPEPEIREGADEIEIAKNNKLPKLIDLKDIKGDFHTHSSYDLKPSHDLGINNYEEMTVKAKELRYEYIGFSEHNPKQSGQSEAEIIEIMKKRKADIDKVMKKLEFPNFIGLEVDIMPGGELALPVQAIDYVDYLIVSIHSSFKMPIKEMTKRVLKAMSYPKVKIFGHPTARLLGKRDGVDLDWDQIFDYVKKKNIALEINASPSRLDLPDTLVKEGKDLGVKFFIDTDAHAAVNMEWMKYGVYVARRGWLERGDVVNGWEVNKLRKWLLES